MLRTLKLCNYPTPCSRDFVFVNEFSHVLGLLIFTISPGIGGDFIFWRVFSCKLLPMLRFLSVHNFPYVLGTFLFLRVFPCTGDFYFSGVFHVLRKLSFYDLPHVLEIPLFTNIHLYWRRCLFISLSPALGTLSSYSFFPVLETLSFYKPCE